MNSLSDANKENDLEANVNFGQDDKRSFEHEVRKCFALQSWCYSIKKLKIT